MTQETKVISGIGVVTVAILVGAIFFLSKPSEDTATVLSADPKVFVREDSHSIAPNPAKVTIVEFGDYQCPACAALQPTVKELILRFTPKKSEQVNIVYRHFPLPQHKYALISAEAAEAAGEQGKFWEMHEKLYETQTQWAESNNPLEIFVGYAKDLGLNIEQFKQAVESNKFASKIQQDKNDGVALGINSTPTFFINGKKLEDAPSFDNFKSKIEAELNK